MIINTKFAIGDEVYVICKEYDDEVSIFIDVIEDIVVGQSQISYYLCGRCDKVQEDELISIEDRGKVIDKIDELLKEETCEKEM